MSTSPRQEPAADRHDPPRSGVLPLGTSTMLALATAAVTVPSTHRPREEKKLRGGWERERQTEKVKKREDIPKV